MVNLVDKVAEEQERKRRHERLLSIVGREIKCTELKVSAIYDCHKCFSHIMLYRDVPDNSIYPTRKDFIHPTRKVMVINGLYPISIHVRDNAYLALAKSIGKEYNDCNVEVRYTD